MMDLEEITKLRGTVEALQTNNKASFKAAVPEALWFARLNPREVVHATVVGLSDSVPRVCRTFRALAPAGAPFRSIAASELQSLVAAPAKVLEKGRESTGCARARRDLAVLARLADEWDTVYSSDGYAIRRVVSHLTSQYSTFRKFFEEAKGRRERKEREANDIASGLSASEREQVPDLSALVSRKKYLVGKMEDMLNEVKMIFSVLGEAGVSQLTSGGSDGVRDALRDVWARLIGVEEELSGTHKQSSLRLRLVSLNVGDEARPTAAREAAEITTELRAALDRVEHERAYCRALRIHVPDLKGIVDATQNSDANDSEAQSSDDAEEWDDAVIVKESDSEGEYDRRGNEAASQLPGGGSLSATVPALVKPGKVLTSSAEVMKAVTGRTTAAEHNSQVLAKIGSSSSQPVVKRTGNEPSRERLRKKLGKKRARPAVTLSPEPVKKGCGSDRHMKWNN